MKIAKHVTKGAGNGRDVGQHLVDDWTRLDRFLILGSEGGTYYASERELTLDNASVVERCVKADGVRTVRRIVEISTEGRAPKNDAALFALAIAAKKGDDLTRKLANAELPKVARTGTHLFHFAEAVKALGGWGRGTRTAFQNWYLNRAPTSLAMQLVKYQQRDGWSHRDIMRKCHAKTRNETVNALLHWAVKGWPGIGEEPHPDEALRTVWAFERAKRTKDEAELIRLITDYRLPHECVPNEFKNSAKVWDAMLPHMGLTATIRNLGKMTAVGLIAPFSAAGKLVVEKLQDQEQLVKQRVHPLQILVALRTYAQGHGDKGKLSWTPDARVVGALDRAFYSAFKTVEPTGKNTLLAIDVSGSMTWHNIAGMPIKPREASAAMALITASVEPNYYIMGFSHRLVDIRIRPGMALADCIHAIESIPMGATDCAQPMRWAINGQVPVDIFHVYTDNETNQGTSPSIELKRHRERSGLNAKLVVAAMTASDVSIADPNDHGMMDVAGFDTAAPAIMADFARS